MLKKIRLQVVTVLGLTVVFAAIVRTAGEQKKDNNIKVNEIHTFENVAIYEGSGKIVDEDGYSITISEELKDGVYMVTWDNNNTVTKKE